MVWNRYAALWFLSFGAAFQGIAQPVVQLQDGASMSVPPHYTILQWPSEFSQGQALLGLDPESQTRFILVPEVRLPNGTGDPFEMAQRVLDIETLDIESIAEDRTYPEPGQCCFRITEPEIYRGSLIGYQRVREGEATWLMFLMGPEEVFFQRYQDLALLTDGFEPPNLAFRERAIDREPLALAGAFSLLIINLWMVWVGFREMAQITDP